MDYREVIRKLRAKAADDAVTLEESRALLAKAAELEAKFPEPPRLRRKPHQAFIGPTQSGKYSAWVERYGDRFEGRYDEIIDYFATEFLQQLIDEYGLGE